MQASLNALRPEYKEYKCDALLALAELELEEGRAQTALEYTTEAAKVGGLARPATLYWMGRSLEKLGKTADALLAYRSIPQGALVYGAAAARIKLLTAGD